MTVYLDVLILLNFLVDFLLLIGTNRLSGHPLSMKRAVLGALLGGFYGGVCILPGFRFLGDLVWRIVALVLIAGVGFGFQKSAVSRGAVFILLSMALGGIAASTKEQNFLSLLFSAIGLCVAVILVFRGKLGSRYVPVEIPFSDGIVKLTALVDTGNLLTDPLTGQPILVASSRVGCKLLGLKPADMQDPVGVVTKAPGCRLITIETAGQGNGMLPVKRYENVTVGKRTGSYLVAFAGHDIGSGKPYDALTGGEV